MGGDFEDTLKKQIQEKTGAPEIKLEKRIMPELLGGCRLRMDSTLIDASLRSQLQKMAVDLKAGGM
jgi:F-type H+-transporting ATPase subunit delta